MDIGLRPTNRLNCSNIMHTDAQHRRLPVHLLLLALLAALIALAGGRPPARLTAEAGPPALYLVQAERRTRRWRR